MNKAAELHNEKNLLTCSANSTIQKKNINGLSLICTRSSGLDIVCVYLLNFESVFSTPGVKEAYTPSYQKSSCMLLPDQDLHQIYNVPIPVHGFIILELWF